MDKTVEGKKALAQDKLDALLAHVEKARQLLTSNSVVVATNEGEVHNFYHSPASIDFTVKYNGETLGCVQRFAISKSIDSKAVSALTFIALVSTDEEVSKKEKVWSSGRMLNKEGILEISAMNEFGEFLELTNEKIKFTRFSTAVSIDDIVTEYVYEFKFVREEEKDG